MRTFSIQTLGCKVNQYESEQMAQLLRSRGWTESDAGSAELRIVNTCSVTMEAASKSRQMVRRAVRAGKARGGTPPSAEPEAQHTDISRRATGGLRRAQSSRTPQIAEPAFGSEAQARREAQHKVIVTGCWATSDKEEAARMPGVGGVITHHDDVAERLTEIASASETGDAAAIKRATSPFSSGGRVALPLLSHRQPQQRAFLKIQDGCDAHCTYCIIPKLRPRLWSKPVGDLVTEAMQLVDAGHVEVVLTGVFLGAYGHETALRRRREPPPLPSPGVPREGETLADAIEALCTEVPGLLRVRLSSLEPGDVDERLLDVLKSHEQVVPHLHLPLQSGSDALLRRMNRQYSREDFLRLVDRIHAAFDRPALTTDIIVGFPGETEAAFDQTLDVVRKSRFIDIHAFPYSPRPGTAAARWKEKFVPSAVADRRIDSLREVADEYSFEYRSAFVGHPVQLLVERMKVGETSSLRHGRCERYFDVHFESDTVAAGDLVEVKVDRVTRARTFGTMTSILSAGPEPR